MAQNFILSGIQKNEIALGDDSLSGDAGNDRILGGQGEDKISGGAGNDYLGGDKGSDTLTGGDGADTFVLQAGFGIDTVTDFEVTQDKFILPAGVKFETLKFDEISASETEIFIEGASSPLVVVFGVGSQEFKEAFFIEPEVTPGNTIESSFDLGVVEGVRRFGGFVGTVDPYSFFKFSVQDYTTLNVPRTSRNINLDVFGDVNRDGKRSVELVTTAYSNGYSLGGDDHLEFSSTIDLPPGEYTLAFKYLDVEPVYLMFSKSSLNSRFDPPSSLPLAYDLGVIDTGKPISITEYVGAFDSSDVYKVKTNKPGQLRVDQESTSGLAVFPYIILDVDKNGIFESRTDENLGDSSAVEVGEYYIQVPEQGSGTIYQLEISLS
jgi:hypothetical protein